MLLLSQNGTYASAGGRFLRVLLSHCHTHSLFREFIFSFTFNVHLFFLAGFQLNLVIKCGANNHRVTGSIHRKRINDQLNIQNAVALDKSVCQIL